MAAYSNTQTPLSKIEDSIECSICTHRFREPKWLNCFHTFCLQCLQEICKNQRPQCQKLSCPLCREETTLTNGNVSDLPDNSDMKALVESFTQQEKVLKQKFEQLEVFSTLVAKARRSKTEFELSAESLDKSLKTLDQVFCDTKGKIRKKATKEVFRIREEEQKLIKEVENIHKNKVEFLKSLQASDRREATQTAHKLDEVNHLMTGGATNGNKGQDLHEGVLKLFLELEVAILEHPQSVPDGLTFMDFKENDEGSLGKLVQKHDDLTLKKQHPTPGSVPSFGIPTGASPTPPASPDVVNTQGLTTGTAHDMNNKGAPGRPGLTPSPHQQGNVVQQQQPPQGMIIQPQHMIQQQGGRQIFMPMSNQQNPRGGIQIQQAPSSGPLQQMTAGSQMNPINQFMPNQQFVIPMMQQQQLNMPQFQQREPVYQQQAHLSQPQPQYQQRQVYQRPQFTPQNPQGQLYTQASTPPYYSSTQQVNLPRGGATFFQNNQQGMVPPQMRPQAYQATLPQAPQYNASRKSLIRILDPKSNQDITETIIRFSDMTTGSPSPHSGQSSASGIPPASQTPPQNHQANETRADIHARFAAQVARLAYDVPVTRVPRNAETQD